VVVDGKSKRRDKLVIMTEIIGICRNGSAKTNILFKANLSFAQLTQYLCYLSELGFLGRATREGRDVYWATSRGLEFMAMQLQIINMVTGKDQKSNLKSSPFSVTPFPRNKANVLY
jgi:predicted transcriptional regulator